MHEDDKFPASEEAGEAGAAADRAPQEARESLEQCVESLRRELAEKEQEAAQRYDQYVRERAELENFKRRMQRDKQEAVRYAAEPLVRDLLPVLDDLERAVEHADGSSDQALVAGVRMVLKSARNVLQSYGVSRVDAVGQPFDPAHHEALAQHPHPEHPANHVIEQYRPGYRLHDRLLRPAQVTVSSGPPVETRPNDD